MQQQDYGKTLMKILQKVQPGFAYDVISLEIDIQEQKVDKKSKNDNRISKITRLISLYMTAVEALQGASDKRYKYFSKKMQTLMSKKHIVEQLHVASTGQKATKQHLSSSSMVLVKQRKSELDLQMFFNKQQFDSKKVKEILNTAQHKFKKLQGHISKDIKKQDQRLQERLKLRKLRSENGSLCNFDINGSNSPDNMEVKDKRLEAFDTQEPIKKRKGSREKDETKKILLKIVPPFI